MGRSGPLNRRLDRVFASSGAGLASPSFASTASVAGNYVVYRHLQDGDLMLTNRQPTLHKPGEWPIVASKLLL